MGNGVASSPFGVARDARRRRMTISEALRWAWSEELPKEPAAAFYAPPAGYVSAFAAVSGFGELHSIVDRQPNRFGCIPFDRADHPHPDALRMAAAVSSLAECEVDVPANWQPMPELLALDDALAARAARDVIERTTVRTDAGVRRFRSRADALVVRYAILGVTPPWQLSTIPERRYEAFANGVHRWFVQRPVSTVIGENPDGTDMIETSIVEVDGWSARLKRPVAGAYRKPYLDPDPLPVMVARAEYEQLTAALAMLAAELAASLQTIELMPDAWPERPWERSDADARKAKILPDLRQMAEAIVAENRSRKSMRKRGRARLKKRG